MSCLISKFDQFTLNSDDDEEKVLYGYILKAKSSKTFFAYKNDFVLLVLTTGTDNIELMPSWLKWFFT